MLGEVSVCCLDFVGAFYPWHEGEGFHLGEVLVLSGCSLVGKLAEGVTVVVLGVVLLDMGTVGR